MSNPIPDPPQPTQPQTPTHREVLVLGRAGGGALDPETGERFAGSVSFYEKGEQVVLQPGDLVEVPVKVAAEFLSEGYAVDPNEVPEPEDDADEFEDTSDDDDNDDESEVEA